MYGSRLPPVVRGGHALNHNFALCRWDRDRDSVDDTVVPKDKMSQTVPMNQPQRPKRACISSS